MFKESFNKTAGLQRILGSKGTAGKALFAKRMESISKGVGRTAEKYKPKTFSENVGGVSRGSLLTGERDALRKKTTSDVRERAKRIFGGEGKPSTLGRIVAKHPVAAGVGTYAASKAAFGEKKQDEPGPQVIYPQTGY